MCLIILAWQAHPDYPLVVAANRDEFFTRPASVATFWTEAPQVLAGRDLEAGGTWLGISQQQRFAALTNYREGGSEQNAHARSRGALTADFLTGDCPADAYLTQVAANAGQYNGFNLFVGDGQRLGYFSNRGQRQVQWLAPGIHGLSNHLLDTPWPKLTSAKAAFTQALDTLPDSTPFFALLADREIVADSRLPATGVPLAWERLLSAVFVWTPGYGTRASTVLHSHRDGRITLRERSFDADGQLTGEIAQDFQSSLISTGV